MVFGSLVSVFLDYSTNKSYCGPGKEKEKNIYYELIIEAEPPGREGKVPGEPNNPTESVVVRGSGEEVLP